MSNNKQPFINVAMLLKSVLMLLAAASIIYFLGKADRSSYEDNVLVLAVVVAICGGLILFGISTFIDSNRLTRGLFITAVASKAVYSSKTYIQIMEDHSNSILGVSKNKKYEVFLLLILIGIFIVMYALEVKEIFKISILFGLPVFLIVYAAFSTYKK